MTKKTDDQKGDAFNGCEIAEPERLETLANLDAYADVAAREHVLAELEKRTHDLGERVKELHCLYSISALVERPDISLSEVLQGTVDLIPPAWQYPDITGGRIVFEGLEFKTHNDCGTSVSQQATDILVHGNRAGVVEVSYFEARPESDEGPFLSEERSLLNAIAERLGKFIERIRAEEALQRSEAKYRSLFEFANDSIFIIDPETHRFLDVNENAAKRLGYSKEELLQLNLDDIYAPTAATRNRVIFRELRQRGNAIFEHAHRRKDGTEMPVEISSRVIDYNGRRVFQSFARDITDRKHAEAALRDSEKLLRAVAASYPAYLSIIERDGERLSIGFTSGREFVKRKLDPNQFTGLQLEDVFGEHSAKVRENYLKAFEGDEVSFELTIFDQHQSYTVVPLYDEYGKVPRILAVVDNVTEQVQAEEELRKARDELEQRVRARTAALEETNLELQAEIAERKQAEEDLRLGEERFRQLAETLEQRVEERTRELSTLLDISHNVALTLELEPLLDMILSRLHSIVDFDEAVILKLEDEVLTALAHHSRNSHAAMREMRFNLEDVLLGQKMVFYQEAVIISDIHNDSLLAEEFRSMIGERFDGIFGRVRSWMGVPITIKNRVTGILTLQHGKANHFSPNQAGLLRAFANQVAAAIENTRLYEQAQELAALEERQRLARDLHDAVSQTLFSASLAAEVLPRLWERKPDEARQCLEELHRLTRSALAEMRTLLVELRPAALLEVGLDDLLRQLVEATTGRTRFPLALTVEGSCSVPPEVQVMLYRIAQEALSNIVKHAGATHATVSLRTSPQSPIERVKTHAGIVELRISDDGCGFERQRVPADRLGLKIMEERAEAIGAHITLWSGLDRGTQVTVVWPKA